MIKSSGIKEIFLPMSALVCVIVYFLAAFFLMVDRSFFVGCDDVAKGVYSLAYIDFFISGTASPLSWRWDGFYVCFPYVGQVPQYFAAGFLFLFSGLLGPLLAFRLTCVFFGTGILLCVFFVLESLCSRKMALWTVFFLGTNSMFIQSVKLGFWREEIFQIFGLWLGVLCLVKGFKNNKNWLFGCGMFVFGVTLWAKMMFPGYMIGAAAGAVVLSFSGYSLRRHLSAFTLSRIILGAAAFTAGCLPLIVYNLFVAPNATAAAMFAPLLKYRETGVGERLSWFLGNLFARADDVFHYTTTMLYRDDYGMHWFGCVFTWCAAAWCLWLVFSPAAGRGRRRFLVFIFTAYSVLLFLTGFIVLYYLSQHIIILVPFFEMLCAVFVVDVFERIKKPFIVFILSVLIISGWSWGHMRYEYERYQNKESRRGYLWDDFLRQDMENILADLKNKDVKNLCSIHDFYGPFEFFYPALNVVQYHCPEDVGKVCSLDSGQWFLFTDKTDVKEIERMWQCSITLESEYISRVGKYEKLYLFRIVKDAETK